MPKPNDRIGPYELIHKLGKGAFGEVWLAVIRHKGCDGKPAKLRGREAFRLAPSTLYRLDNCAQSLP